MTTSQTFTEEPGFTIRQMTEDEFSHSRESWNRLLDASASESFFLRWEWVYTFWESMDSEDAELQVWLCHQGSRLVGIAPLYTCSSSYLKIPVRKLAFLGDRVAGDYMDIIAEPGYEESCCRAVLHRIRHRSMAAYDVLELDCLCTDSVLYRHLHSASDADDGFCLMHRFDCPRTVLAESFDSHMQGLSASTRYALGRKQRKLERTYERVVTGNFDLVGSPDMLDELFNLHRKRWDSMAGRQSTFSTPYRELFNSRLLRRLKEDDGFFSCMSVDDRPVSILYIFRYKNNAFFYQNGWDPAFAAYGIGLLNIQQAIRHAIDTGCRTFDFLRGEEAYKYKFCEDSRQAYAVMRFGPGIRGRAAGALFRIRGWLKELRANCRNIRAMDAGPGSQDLCLQGR